MNEIIKKVENLKKSHQVDLSTEEDLSLGIMNLVSLEEHFFFTAQKTRKPEYLDFLIQIREIRKDLMARMIPRHEGETWCISKHLLAATMRLMEVGTKLRADKNLEDSQKLFSHAYTLYSLFWALRLKLINIQGVRGMALKDQPWTLQDIVNKLVDCCDE